MAAPLGHAEHLARFRTMVEADPNNELAHFSLGRLYFEAGDLANAERSLRRTLELNPRHSVSHRILGEVLLRTGRNEEAVELLKKGVVLAHGKGEYQPRNQMQELLRALGVSPPDPAREERERRGGAKDGEFVCRRCGLSNPRLEEAPFENALGREILSTVCQSCWREWLGMSIKVINEYRLNLASPQGAQVFDLHMKEFLGLTGEP